MQHHTSAGIAQRLIQEKSFREAVRTAFSGSQSSDLLQRCRALNACIQQVCQQKKLRCLSDAFALMQRPVVGSSPTARAARGQRIRQRYMQRVQHFRQ